MLQKRPLSRPPPPHRLRTLRTAQPTAPSAVEVPTVVTAAPPSSDGRFALLLGLILWVQIGNMVLTFNWGDSLTDVLNGFEANPTNRAIKIALLLIGAIVVTSRMQITLPVLRGTNRFFVAFLILVPASILWSINRSATTARCITMASMVAVCLAFSVGAWNPRRYQNVVRPVLTLILLASLIVGFFHPSYVIEKGDSISLKNAWHGLTSQKNIFGMLASGGTIFWVHAWLAREKRVPYALVGGAICAACLLLSRSSTSLMATLFSCLFLLLLLRSPPALRRYRPYLIALFASATVLYGCAVMKFVPGTEFLLSPITRLTGKDTTFSARTTIWGIVRENIAQHPYLGSGYNAYWGGGPVPSSPSYQFLARMYFWPSESHNGYLELRNDLGYPGVLVLFGFLYFYLRQALRLMKVDRAQAALFLALFFQQAIVNLFESAWLSVDNYNFVIIGTATFYMSRSLYEYQRGSSAARPALPASSVASRTAYPHFSSTS